MDSTNVQGKNPGLFTRGHCPLFEAMLVRVSSVGWEDRPLTYTDRRLGPVELGGMLVFLFPKPPPLTQPVEDDGVGG